MTFAVPSGLPQRSRAQTRACVRAEVRRRESTDCVGANARGKSAGGMIWLQAIDAAEVLKKRLWPMFCAGFSDRIGDVWSYD
jgi:hypothetical protein